MAYCADDATHWGVKDFERVDRVEREVVLEVQPARSVVLDDLNCGIR